MMDTQPSYLKDISDDCGLTVVKQERVMGGDINKAFRLLTKEKSYFLKVNDAKRYPLMFEREAEGLRQLGASGNIHVPTVLKVGQSNSYQYLLLEWIERGNPNGDFWKKFGNQLAQLHKKPQPVFGWPTDNYIGSIKQQNNSLHNWSDFYSNYRINPLVKRLVDSGDFSKHDVKQSEILCGKLNHLFPTEPPALLHGDLWNGNFLVDENNNPVLIDPAVYCGHREIDLGMTKLFGGFHDAFYKAYHEEYPMEKDWQKRIQLSQLYPLLVHAVLFGGGYVEQARRIMLMYC